MLEEKAENIKLRRVERNAEEQKEYDAIQAKKLADKEKEERELLESENDIKDDESESLFSGQKFDANARSVERHKAVVAQHRLHILKRLMQIARIKHIDRDIQLFTELDQSDKIVPEGEASKHLYENLFHSRNFNLYGELVRSTNVFHPPRKYLELKALAAELGIYFTQKVDTGHPEYLLYEQAKQKKELEADEIAALEASRIPKIVTEKWKIPMAPKYNAPVGFAKNPGEIPESRGNEAFYSYDGDWHKGYMEGRGVYLFDDDLKYEGEFKASKPHGQGSTTYPGGQSYTGAWKNGRMHGIGKTVYGSGSVYEGTFDTGRRNGMGKLTLPCGLTYEGEFLDGKPHGRGIMKSKLTGWVYEGTFERGSICGSGVLISPPPENKRIVQYWPETKTETILPTAVRRYLKELEEEKIFRARQDQSTFGPLRGAQLKTYVTNIRKALYAEQQKEKKQKFMEALQKQKEQKDKLNEARLRALAGDDDDDEAG